MIRLIINSAEVDIIQKGFRQTKQVNDIGDIGNRKSNFTNTFQCPLTANNLEVFTALGVTGNLSDIPYERPPAIVFEDGIQVISNGIAVINETTTDYQVVIYDGGISLPEAVGQQTLRDIDYTTINHDLSVALYLDSFTNTTGYIYGFARYDFELYRANFFLNATSPSIFVSTLWDLIFTQNGLTYSGDIFTEPYFLNKVVSVGEGFIADIQTTPVDVTNGADTQIVGLIANTNNQTHAVTTINILSDDSYLLAIDSDQLNTVGSITRLEFRVLNNGTPIITINQLTTTHLIDNYDLNLENGDVLTIQYIADAGAGISSYEYDITWDLDSTNKRQPIAFEDLVTDTLQIDFLKAVMQFFGIIYQQRGTADFEFIELEVLLRDRANAEDWSDIYDSTNKEEYRDNAYGQTTSIDFSYDSNYDVEDKDFADGSFSISDVNLDAEKTLFTSVFTATSEDLDNPESYPGLPPLPLLQLFHFEDDGAGDPQPTEDVFRLFEIQEDTLSLNVQFEDDENFINYNNDVPILTQPTWDDLITQSYAALEEIFIRYQKREVVLDLSTIDFLNIDFLRLKYIRQLGDYFYVNKVSNYRSDQLNKIDLIRTKAV